MGSHPESAATQLGTPLRQHVVVYFRAKLPGAATDPLPELRVQRAEVGAAVWVTMEQACGMIGADRRTADAVASSSSLFRDAKLSDEVATCPLLEPVEAPAGATSAVDGDHSSGESVWAESGKVEPRGTVHVVRDIVPALTDGTRLAVAVWAARQ